MALSMQPFRINLALQEPNLCACLSGSVCHFYNLPVSSAQQTVSHWVSNIVFPPFLSQCQRHLFCAGEVERSQHIWQEWWSISIKPMVTWSTHKVTGSKGFSWTVSHITERARIQTVRFSTYNCILLPSTSQIGIEFCHLKEDPSKLESILHINKIFKDSFERGELEIKWCLTLLNCNNPILKN